MQNAPHYAAITLDIDWAPDFVIDFVAERLVEHQVRATWFVTHPSPAIERLKDQPDLFELGLHPNFLPGSSQGATPEHIIRYCRSIVPEAVSVRTHALVQSTPLLDTLLDKTSVVIDASLFLPHALHLHPVEYWWRQRRLIRVPYFWEDDFEMERPEPCWQPAKLLNQGPGLKIFDFHPIHIYLNSADMEPYRNLKAQVPRLHAVDHGLVERFVQEGPGTQTCFLDLVHYLAASGSQRLCDLVGPLLRTSKPPGTNA